MSWHVELDLPRLAIVHPSPQNALFVGILLREVCRKSKWKFKMAFAMKGGGGGLEGVSFAIKLF